MCRAVRGTIRLLAVLCGIGLFAAPAAHAIQASGSIILSPSQQLGLSPGDQFELTVSIVNTSSHTPLPPGPDAPATLTGPIAIDLACTDCDCSSKQSGAITFIPGPVDGCVSHVPGVTSCSSGGSTVVLINLAPGGLSLPAGSAPVEIARIRLQMNTDSGPPLGIRAGTGVCALTACITPPDQGCVSCSAEGCTFVTPQQGNQPCDCPHQCANKLRFIGDAAKPDFFEFHSIILPSPGFDPVNQPFSVSLSNAIVGQIFSFTLPPGSLKKGGDAFTYTNNQAANTGGVKMVKLAARDDLPGAFRLDIQGYSPNIQPDTTIPMDIPDMTVEFSVGGQSWTTGVKTWDRKNFGWQLNEFGTCRP
ncbi:MAG TPA: hypothetical protein VIS07_15915 [Candidatus Binatia bacterium]